DRRRGRPTDVATPRLSPKSGPADLRESRWWWSCRRHWDQAGQSTRRRTLPDRARSPRPPIRTGSGRSSANSCTEWRLALKVSSRCLRTCPRTRSVSASRGSLRYNIAVPPIVPRGQFMKCRLSLLVLVLIPLAARAALNPESDKPYQLQVVVHFG